MRERERERERETGRERDRETEIGDILGHRRTVWIKTWKKKIMTLKELF
jgi:hypothetical protein